MFEMHNTLIFGLVFILLQIDHSLQSSCRGCVELDELTFDRTLRRYPDGALVKFDIAYPYGEKHEAYSKFAEDVATAVLYNKDGEPPAHHDLLVATVGIKDYGEKDNDALARRYDVSVDFPEIQLFIGGASGKRMVFPKHEEITPENLKQFVRRHTRVYVGLAGCIRDLDQISQKFAQQVASNGPSGGTNEIEEAEQWVANKLNNPETSYEGRAGGIYVTLMRRIQQYGLQFVQTESGRVKQLLSAKISKEKRNELEIRLNVLKAFDVRPSEEAAEVFSAETDRTEF